MEREKLLSEKLEESISLVKAKKKVDKLQNLPNELQLFVMVMLDPKEWVLRLQKCSKYWKEYVQNP